MTEKQKATLNKILDALPDEHREAFREVAEYAVSLGYMPVLKGSKKDYADFVKSKVKRTILKIDVAPTPPRLAIKYFALPAYSSIFYDGIEERVNMLEKMGHKVRCWGCKKCDSTQGYNYVLSDGREGFLCGGGLLDLAGFSAENISEVKAALKTQDDFFMNNFN